MQTKEEFLRERGWKKGTDGYTNQWRENSIDGWFTIEDAYIIERERLLRYIHTSITLNREVLGRSASAHRIINLQLSTIGHCFGVRQENAMIRQCRLDKVGWQERPEFVLVEDSKKHSKKNSKKHSSERV